MKTLRKKVALILIALVLVVMLSLTNVSWVLLSVTNSGAKNTVIETELTTSPHRVDQQAANDVSPKTCAKSMHQCPLQPRSYEPLGEFKFWGKMMNSSSPCPTAGMNNQLMMVLGLTRCAADHKMTPFRWKDISCSPTGGKDKAVGKYAVGGSNYEYAWFRWSEVFDTDPKYLCLSDTYSWSEGGPKLKKCKTAVDHFYALPRYWEVRKALVVKPQYYKLAADILSHHGLELSTSSSRSSSSTSCSTSLPSHGRFLAVHIRRGDYYNFCLETSRGSGVKKFLTPPYKWLRGNSTSLSGKFMQSCAPGNELVAQHVRRIVTDSSKDEGEPQIKHLVVASNSAEFVASMRSEFKGQLEVISTGETLRTLFKPKGGEDEGNSEIVTAPSYWPRKYLTKTDMAVLDIVVLSLAEYIVLNKYSTFSHSAIDFRVLRNGGVEGLKLHWW